MKNCKNCGKQFDPSSAREHAEIHGIPEPNYCRICSWQRKLAYQNEYNVYKRKCEATGKTIISVYKDDAEFPVYDRKFWLSDEWDAPQMDYDGSRPFFGQYWEFYAKVPRPSANCVNAENSEYAHLIFDSKSCFLSFQVFLCEKVIGCYRVVRMRDSVNCFFCTGSELLCECANCHKSYNLKFCEDCEDCSDSAFLFDCRGCRNCFMCRNLRNKQYYFKNQKLSKEEYETKIKEYSNARARAEFENLRDQFLVKFSHQINCEKCEGDYLVNCKGCKEIYFSDGCEDSLDILRGTEDINCCDAVVGGKIELCYNILQPGYSYKCAFGMNINNCNEVYLSEYCDHCNDCVGCISLKRGKFCIFNKKYSEEEYRELKAHIFEELGASDGGFEEFFDPAKSPFGYEETIADLYIPRNGFSGEKKFNENGKCGYCGRVFQFADAEKRIYEKMGVELPDACFNCRIQRMSRPYSAIEMVSGECEKCGCEVLHGKSGREFGKLYCLKCYEGELY